MPALATKPKRSQYSTDELSDLIFPSSEAKNAIAQFENALARAWKTSTFLQVQERFEGLLAALYRFSLLSDNWNSYDAEKPSKNAIRSTARFLKFLYSDLLVPTRLIPSAEGGLAVYFGAEDKTAYIEFRNTGEVVLAMYDELSEPIIVELSDTDEDDIRAAGLLRGYFSPKPADAPRRQGCYQPF
ncbi:MAG TPA: hypothetical protein VF133_16355 [Terriglobales bacterium]